MVGAAMMGKTVTIEETSMLKSLLSVAATAGFCLATPSGGANAAAKEKNLYGFKGTDGYSPVAPVAMDAAGNLYGTNQNGGTDGMGTVYQLIPPAQGEKNWTENTIYGFVSHSTDGANPRAGVILDASGNLFGATEYGGQFGGGTVFELSPPLDGEKAWTETILYSFGGSTDGSRPQTGLIVDSAGNFYGTTLYGGAYGDGTVYRLTPPRHGKIWNETILRSFGNKNDGQFFRGNGIIGDASWNIYGTTTTGGKDNQGIAFELIPPVSGSKWTENILYQFVYNSKVGGNPMTGLTFDSAGNLYGTTSVSADASGTVFRLTPPTKGGKTWAAAPIYGFTPQTGTPAQGASLLLTLDGKVFGTYQGQDGPGAVFELKPPAKGKSRWAETVLYSFTGDNGDGYLPSASLITDAAGNLYSTTAQGGGGNLGTVYEITP
jgi:uncharacterized repeat protein (TIGR03803 family)